MENLIIRNENFDALRKLISRCKFNNEYEIISGMAEEELIDVIMQDAAGEMPKSPAGTECRYNKSLDLVILDSIDYISIYYDRIPGQDGKLPYCFENEIKINLKGN